MFSKIDVRVVVVDHLRTLTKYESDRLDVGDFLLFFGVPGAIAWLLCSLGIAVSDSSANLLINAFAIFAGLLLNVLLLVHGLIARYTGPTGNGDTVLLLRSLFANISFAILLALITLIPLVALDFVTGRTATLAISAFVYFAVTNFLLTLLMVLKRVHAVVGYEFKRA